MRLAERMLSYSYHTTMPKIHVFGQGRNKPHNLAATKTHSYQNPVVVNADELGNNSVACIEGRLRGQKSRGIRKLLNCNVVASGLRANNCASHVLSRRQAVATAPRAATASGCL